MDDVGQALRAARDNSGLTHSELAERLGVHRVTVVNRESGRRGIPAADLLDIARATGCTVEATPEGWRVLEPGSTAETLAQAQARIAELEARLAREDRFLPNPNREETHTVEREGDGLPLVGEAGAGPAVIAPDHVAEWVDLDRRWLRKVDRVIQVKGTSMQPLLYPGDLVGVRVDEEPQEGNVVVVECEPDGDLLIKLFRGAGEGRILLQSVNPPWDTFIMPGSECRIRGVAYGLLRLEPVSLKW